MNESARHKITRARSQLIIHKPFWGYLSCYLEPAERADLAFKSMATDGKKLYYDPEFVNKLDIDQLQGCIAHEIYHAGFGHIWRKGTRSEMRWNAAIDCVTNVHLMREGFRLPEGLLMVGASHHEIESVSQLSAEELYEQIQVMEVAVCVGGSPSDGDDGQSSGSGSGNYQVELPNGSQTTGRQLDDHDVQAGGDGNGAGDGNGDSKTKDKSPRSNKPADSAIGEKEIEQRWREYVSRARQMAKSQGSGMGSMDELIDELLDPVMDWREWLRNFMLSSVISDYRLCPPNKRHLWRGIYLPSTNKEDEVEVIFVTDTSGSMSTEELRDALSEVVGITSQFAGYRIWYTECDWDIQRITEITPYNYQLDEIKKVKGRGGTQFPVQRIVSEVQNNHNGNPSVVIYFTDSEGHVEGDDPGLPVFWLVCHQHREFNPPFGTVVEYTSQLEVRSR